jgi:hypothetical protein
MAKDKFLTVKFDASDFLKVIDRIATKVDSISMRALMEMGDSLLNLSNKEVPHDEGTLQSTGIVDPDMPRQMVTVGYHTPYAARLHEHPEYRFQKGRKGKYLEDPLKHNLSRWLTVYAKEIGALL